VVVATSGSRRLGRPRAIVALGLPSLVCVGCTASHVASAPRSPANRSASATRSAVGSSWAKLCEARPTRAILAALSRSVPLSLRAEVDPIGLSGNGRTAYVSLWSSQFAGVATLNLTSGKLRPIQAFANPATDQADGASDGRWLVWGRDVFLAEPGRLHGLCLGLSDRQAAHAWTLFDGSRRAAMAKPVARSCGRRSLCRLGAGLRAKRRRGSHAGQPGDG